MDDENKRQLDSSENITDSVSSDNKTLGVWLKEQRAKKKISLEEIAAVTKIHIAQLRNIEEDQMADLPAPAFVRGFLVSYARHLGLSEDEVIAKYRSSLGERTSLEEPMLLKGNRAVRSSTEPRIRVVGTPTFTQNAASNDLEQEKNSVFRPKVILISILLILVLAGIGLLMTIGKSSKKQNSIESAVPALVNNAPASSETLSPPLSSAPPIESATVPKVAPVLAPAPVAKQAPAAPKKYQLEIRALEQNWVNLRVDDGNSQGLLLKGGTLSSFQADRKLVLSLSDAGAVEIRWNGAWFASPGFRGDVKSLTLPDELSSLTPKAAPKPKPKAPSAPPAAAPAVAPPDVPVPTGD